MIVYVDGLLFLNFFFDFLLLLTTSIILKRNVTIFRVMLGAFFGSLSILVLFFQINSFELFLIKLYLGFLMCIISFGYKNIKYFLTSMGTFYLLAGSRCLADASGGIRKAREIRRRALGRFAPRRSDRRSVRSQIPCGNTPQ